MVCRLGNWAIDRDLEDTYLMMGWTPAQGPCPSFLPRVANRLSSSEVPAAGDLGAFLFIRAPTTVRARHSVVRAGWSMEETPGGALSAPRTRECRTRVP